MDRIACPTGSDTNGTRRNSNVTDCQCSPGYYGTEATNCTACVSGDYCPGGTNIFNEYIFHSLKLTKKRRQRQRKIWLRCRILLWPYRNPGPVHQWNVLSRKDRIQAKLHSQFRLNPWSRILNITQHCRQNHLVLFGQIKTNSPNFLLNYSIQPKSTLGGLLLY